MGSKERRKEEREGERKICEVKRRELKNNESNESNYLSETGVLVEVRYLSLCNVN